MIEIENVVNISCSPNLILNYTPEMVFFLSFLINFGVFEDFSIISFRDLSAISDPDLENVDDSIPNVLEISTPNNSVDDFSFDLESRVSSEENSENPIPDSANAILRDLRIKNINRVIFGTLNINSLYSKLEQLKEIIGNYLDVLTIQETKLDDSIPTADLMINGYSEPL